MTGILFLVVFLGLMIAFWSIRKDQSRRDLREIPAFSRLKRAIALSVEAGKRLHISLGSRGLHDLRGAPALVGLNLIQKISRTVSVSDLPPIASSGDATLSILSQDALHSGYREVNAESRFDPNSGQLTGLTPFSYAAGALPLITDQPVSVTLLAGSYGSEALLLTDAAERADSLTFAGTENINAQAVLYASASESLIGEELFAAGAYLQSSGMHVASLFAQDVFRWVVIVVLLVGIVLKFAGVL